MPYNSSNKKTIAVIGNGYWGKIIIPYILECFDIKYIVDSKFDKNIIWKDDSIEAVFIITPVNTHFNIAKDALLHKKHVFVEKPITLNYDEAIELYNLSLKVNKQIVTDYIYTFSKGLNTLKYMADSDIKQYIESSTYQLGKYTDFNVFTVLGSHHLSILNMFFDISKLDFEFIPILYKNDVCTTGKILHNFGSILVSLDCNNKITNFKLFTNENIYEYNPKIGIITNVVECRFDESNNLRYSIEFFKNVIEEKIKSNIEESMTITKIIERL